MVVSTPLVVHCKKPLWIPFGGFLKRLTNILPSLEEIFNMRLTEVEIAGATLEWRKNSFFFS